MRGATRITCLRKLRNLFQSTRPMRGATNGRKLRNGRRLRFQSTRPMRGATFTVYILLCTHCPFQSTRPMRGATNIGVTTSQQMIISIHAPHAGRDSKSIQNYFTHFCDKRQFLDNFTQNAAF